VTMQGALASLSAAEAVSIGLAIVLAGLIGVIGYRTWRASRISADERERMRRASLVSVGKMGDATLVEMRDEMLFYTYAVRGVEYTACQDVTRLTSMLPPEFSAMGPVCVKYDARNPANSIVIAEEWSGLRVGKLG
jgi:hypothetical protein